MSIGEKKRLIGNVLKQLEDSLKELVILWDDLEKELNNKKEKKGKPRTSHTALYEELKKKPTFPILLSNEEFERIKKFNEEREE